MSSQILVVDDDPSERFLLRLILEGAGHRVAEAPNGVAAVLLMRDFLPDLLVTDIAMPVMDGLALMKRVRAEGRTARIRVLAISSDPKEVRAASPADAVVGKPLDRSKLLEVVDALLPKEPRQAA